MTGWAMSAHKQDLMISTMIHSVFGYTLMGAGLSRIIEISFVLKDRVTLVGPEGGDVDAEINSFQYMPVFLLYAGGFLFMGATEEQMQVLADGHVTHVSYVLILYSISFLLFLCKCYRETSADSAQLFWADFDLAVVLMLLHLYSYLAPTSSTQAIKIQDEERPRANGSIVTAADRQAHDAQEFELEGLMSDDDDELASKKTNGHANGGPPQLR